MEGTAGALKSSQLTVLQVTWRELQEPSTPPSIPSCRYLGGNFRSPQVLPAYRPVGTLEGTAGGPLVLYVIIALYVRREDFGGVLLGRASGTQGKGSESLTRSCRCVVTVEALGHLACPPDHVTIQWTFLSYV
jgi:hypothetical protein